MNVAGVVSCIGWEDAGEWINPRSRTQVPLLCALRGEISVGATDAKVSEIAAWLTTEVAAVGLFCAKGVFCPGLANLLEAIVVARATAHSIEILSYGRVICPWNGKVTNKLVPGIARSDSRCQAALGSDSPELFQVSHVPRNNIRPGVKG
jgi:hypothetical protein